MASVALVVDGRKYGGWTSIRVTRSIERVAGSFALGAHDRWAGQDEAWPIAEESACRVELEGKTVIEGYIDSRSISLDGETRELSYTGRSASAVLIDCSALPPWTYRRATVLDAARKIAAPYGIAVSLNPNVTLPPPSKVVVNPGETAWQAIQRVAQVAGVLIVSDGSGGLDIVRAGEADAESLVEGVNILSGSIAYDGSQRFSRYVVYASNGGTDRTHGESLRVKAEATDDGVARTTRVKIIRPRKGMDTAGARRRADWEARIRAARAETLNITVHGWTQSNGALWPVNALCRVDAPSLGIDGTLLISELTHTLDDGGGANTTIRLVRRDAFTPEPRARVKKTTAKKKTGATP